MAGRSCLMPNLRGYNLAMEKRILIAAVTFFTAFALSAAFAGLFKAPVSEPFAIQETINLKPSGCSQTSRKILNLLKQDDQNGSAMNAAALDFDSYSKESLEKYADAVNDYIEASSAIDDTNLPRDFQAAWRKHLEAWRENTDYLNENKEMLEDEDLNNGKIREIFLFRDREISQTWHEVLSVSKTYGVDFKSAAQ